MIVRELTPALEPAYREFLANHPAASLYASPEYRNFLQSILPGEPRYLIAEANRRIAGVLPLFERDAGPAGVIVNSLPWYGSHGGCLVAADEGDAARTALLGALAARLDDLGDRLLSATVILLPCEEPHRAAYDAALRPAAHDARIGQVTELPLGGADVAAELDRTFLRKTRNLVRKSMRQGFEVSRRDDDEAWGFLYETHRENLAAIGGQSKPWHHFVALRAAMPAEWRHLYLATAEGRPVAALLTVWYRGIVEYLTPVVMEEFRAQQPLSCVIQHAMVEATSAGCCAWNWGGTWASQASLYHFKHGFGARDRPYSYLIVSPDQGARLAALRPQLGELFPYYYVYPYDRIH